MKIIKLVGRMLGILLFTILLFIIINVLVRISEETIRNEENQITELLNKENSINCILKANKRIYKLGEKPDLFVQIVNKLDTSITLIGSLDGSAIGARFPICQFSVKHKILGNSLNSLFPSFYCATLNPTRIEDFQTISSNESFNPYQKIDDYGYFGADQLEGINFYFPGIYEITFYFLTDPNVIENGLGYDDHLIPTSLKVLWEEVPKLDLTSNTITIEYNF